MRQLRFILLALTLLHFGQGWASEKTNDEKKSKNPMFVSLKGEVGAALKTNDYLKATGETGYSALHARYGICPTNDSWQNKAFRMPYGGVGLSLTQTEDDAFGHPFTLYLFQGGRVCRLFGPLSLHYECQLGYSGNWGHYDRFRQPDNITIGSSENVYVGGNLYLKANLSKHWDLNLGAGVCHFSNGASQMPNKGMNIAVPFVEIAYKFNEVQQVPDTAKASPEKPNKIDHQIIATFSQRQKYYSTTGGTGLTTQYVNHSHRVYGLSYARLFVNSYKFRWGPSLDVIYDESANSKAVMEEDPNWGETYEHVHLASPKERLSVGLSLKAEAKMPFCTYFVNLGYDIIHSNEDDTRLYEVLGAKFDISDNIFGVFGIRATRFSKAQFFCWSLGYTLKR